MPHTATHCNTLQHTATCIRFILEYVSGSTVSLICRRSSMNKKREFRVPHTYEVLWVGFTGPISMCAVTWVYVCRDLCIGVPWLVYMCAVTWVYVCRDLSICVPWLVYMCAVTWVYVCRDLCTCVPIRRYGVATVSRIDKIIGLFCRIASVL